MKENGKKICIFSPNYGANKFWMKKTKKNCYYFDKNILKHEYFIYIYLQVAFINNS